MGLLVGWKSIQLVLGVSYHVAIQYMKNYGLPVLYLRGRPTITHTAIDEWWRSLAEQAAKDKMIGKPPSGIFERTLKYVSAQKGEKVRNPAGRKGKDGKQGLEFAEKMRRSGGNPFDYGKGNK